MWNAHVHTVWCRVVTTFAMEESICHVMYRVHSEQLRKKRLISFAVTHIKPLVK